MTRGDGAAHIWPLLTLCAGQRRTLTYDHLGKLIGIPRFRLGQFLEPIQSYCLLKRLPALSSLVVSEIDGLPGNGFVAASNVPAEQAHVFGHDWLATHVPTPEDFEAAVTKLRSNGRPLDELLAIVQAAGPEDGLTSGLPTP